MPCFHPRAAFQLSEGAPLSFTWRRGAKHLEIPCRQCAGCRLQYSAHWATRCMHEAKCHTHNAWLTLTYADEHLPSRYNTGILHPRTNQTIYSGSLHKAHPQKFLRALRKALGRGKYQHAFHRSALITPGAGVRYYYAGEYGELYGRPHYHLCLFGIDLADKLLDRTTSTGYKLYTSPTLEKLWPYGTHQLGELTWESAAYTARYVMKKINGEKKEKHYEKLDTETGEIIKLIPEYCDMSRRPGIAQPWFEKYLTDVYPHDRIIIRGHKRKPPRYYDKKYEQKYPDLMKQIKFERAVITDQRYDNNLTERLRAEEKITERKTQSLKQKL